MGGKSAPAQQAAPQPIKPPEPIPDPNANIDSTRYGATPSYAENEAIEEEKQRSQQGLGSTQESKNRNRGRRKDPAAVAGNSSNLGASAVLTG